MLLDIFWTIEFSPCSSFPKTPASPRRGFQFSLGVQRFLATPRLARIAASPGLPEIMPEPPQLAGAIRMPAGPFRPI
jgi:hypothetical protein